MARRIASQQARPPAHLVAVGGPDSGFLVHHDLAERVVVLDDRDHAVRVRLDDDAAVALARAAGLVDHRVDRPVELGGRDTVWAPGLPVHPGRRGADLRGRIAPIAEDVHLLAQPRRDLSLIHISEPTRLLSISYAVFC